MPDISVVMPVYNAYPYLKESIRSVLTQTFTDFEFIIIDDCSTDDSLSIIHEFDDPRIRLYQMDKNDYIKALNCGMKQARGKYIARMDSDDIMVANRLEVQYQYLERNKRVDVCGSWVESFGEDANVYTPYLDNIQLKVRLLYGNVIFNPTAMIRIESLQRFFTFPKNDVYCYSYPLSEDYCLWCDIVKKGGQLSNIPLILMKYRCRKGQQSRSNRGDMVRQYLQVRKKYISWVLSVLSNTDCVDNIENMIRKYTNSEIGISEFTNLLGFEWEKFLRSN